MSTATRFLKLAQSSAWGQGISKTADFGSPDAPPEVRAAGVPLRKGRPFPRHHRLMKVGDQKKRKKRDGSKGRPASSTRY